MECIRGFSNTFMPEIKLETVDLQYIEGGELERAWKSTRRQRLKEQEQKIWDDFTREQDILSSVISDDPYQFLEELPEVCVQEVMRKNQKPIEDKREEAKVFRIEEKDDPEKPNSPKSPSSDRSQHGVTFATLHSEESGIFHIYSDDRDSEQEEDILNDSNDSPHTVRERSPSKEEKTESPQNDSLSPVESRSNKSSENIANIIESSIYCARVKELRKKIISEINSIIGTLDSHMLVQLEPAELRRMSKRSAEFCGRFQRIHLYQLHRQMYDIKRHNASAMPFAKHTQFQSQMARVVSLHQNMLQSFQVFHKSIEQSFCLRDGISHVTFLTAAARDAARLCAHAVIVPSAHATALYTDKLEQTCEKLDETLKLYEDRVVQYLGPLESSRSSIRRSVRSKNSDKNKGVKKRATPSVKSCKSNAESRLSMYSLDTLRLNLASCPGPKDTPSYLTSSASKVRTAVSRPVKTTLDLPSAVNPKPPKKSPCRRPLMRDPQQGKPRRYRPKDTEIITMVEAVEAPLSMMSLVNSPRMEVTNLYQSMKAPPRRQYSPRARASPRAATTLRIPPNNVTEDTRGKQARLSPKKDKVYIGDGNHEGHVKGNEYCLPNLKELGNEKSVPLEEPSPRCSKRDSPASGRKAETPKNVNPQTGCEVTRLLRQLCGGYTGGYKNERTTGAKNAQLVNVIGSSPRQPSTPQLLRILEETIQKKAPKPICQRPNFQDMERFRLTFNIPETTCDHLLKYRTKFVQYMLTSSMYANGSIGKPWQVIDNVASEIIDEILENFGNEMEISDILEEMLKCETAVV